MLNESVFTTESLFVVGNINRDVKTAPLRPGSHLFEDGEDSVMDEEINEDMFEF